MTAMKVLQETMFCESTRIALKVEDGILQKVKIIPEPWIFKNVKQLIGFKNPRLLLKIFSKLYVYIPANIALRALQTIY